MEAVEDVDLPHHLARHFAGELETVLRSAGSAGQQVALMHALLDRVAELAPKEASEDRVAEPPRMLRSVYRTARRCSRPLSGVATDESCRTKASGAKASGELRRETASGATRRPRFRRDASTSPARSSARACRRRTGSARRRFRHTG